MRIVKKEYKVYKFEELSEEAKEKAIESLYDINVDGEFWYEYEGKTGFSKDEIDMMHKNGLNADHVIPTELIEHTEIYFDLDRGSYIQLVNPRISDSEIARCFCGVSKRIWGLLDYSFYITSGRDGDTKIEFTYCGNKDFKKVNESIEQAIDRINDKIQEVLSNLRKNWEYLTSRKAIEETIRANDYDFTEEGKLF